MQMETKLMWVLVVVLMSCCYCVEGGRWSGGVGGIYGQEQRHQFRKGKSVEAWKTTTAAVAYTAKGVDNHHNIPRQNYDNWGNNGGSPADGEDAGGSGSGQVSSAP